jgi:PAS domain S-box-containing protein
MLKPEVLMNMKGATTDSRWKTFLDNFPDHVAQYDSNFRHLYINKAIEKETGLPLSHLIGKSNRDLNIPNNKQAIEVLENRIRTVFQTHASIDHYTQHSFPEGTRYYHMKLVPEFSPTGTEVTSVWAITRDITALKQYEKKLKKSKKKLRRKNQELDALNAELDTFFYSISHDLRNPLANIKGVIELLKLGDSSQLETYVDLLEKATDRFEEVITGMTEMLELKSRKDAPDKQYFENVLADLQAEFSAELNAVGGMITVDFSACPTIHYPRSYLDSIFRNMISNALKYRSEERPVHLHIRTYREDKHVVLRFQDNGMGIDLDSHRDFIFKPFYRISRQQEGKGIGLHLVKSILEKNGSRIEVESQVNAGTTFICYLKT